MIVKRLEKHILAMPEFDEDTNQYVIKDLMSQSQVTAALGLIKKTLPDLATVEHKGEIIHRDANELSDSELANIAAGSSTGASEQAHSKKVTH